MHYAGTDRLQMVGVRSLHVDRSWLLVSSYSRRRPIFLPPKDLQVRHDWDQILRSTLFFQLISESCNKIMEIILNKMYFIDLCHIVLWVQCYIKGRGRPKKEEQRTFRAIER